MARAMLEYTKTVLKKVSFNVELFSIELKKAVKRLLPDEIEELRVWLRDYINEKPELNGCLVLITK
jgi:hypothetical protein